MRQNFRSVAACIIALTVARGAGAISVTLVPEADTVRVGQDIVVDVVWDFRDDPTIGGGMAIDVGNAHRVALTNVDFLPVATFEPQFDAVCIGVALCGHDIDLVRASFAGIAGPLVAVQLTFLALAPGVVTFEPTGGSIFGPFVSASLPLQYPDFIGASVIIAPVPLPATAWALGAALAILAGLRRRA